MGREPSIRMLEYRRTERLKRIRGVKPFVTDALIRIGRKCGNPDCRCADGEKHPAWILTYKDKGKTKSLYVPNDLVTEVQKWSKEAKRLWQTIMEVNQLQHQIIRQYVTSKRAKIRGKSKVRKISGKI